MGNNGIVLLDIERDQLFKRRECVQLVQKQPAMLHRPPQGFDHGIRVADLDLSEDAVQLAESKKVVDLTWV
jgi:dTDP-4-dehydrorhamnose 3,5-epimerase-like enzyme